MLAVSALLGGQPIAAAQTAAGTMINNVAHVSYQEANNHTEIASNTVGVRVGEIIDVTVTPAPACVGPAPANGVVAIGFLVTNHGNGHEAFIPGTPQVTGDSNFKPTAVVEDSNGDGCYESDIDTVIPAGGSTSEIDPGGSKIIFVIGTGWGGTGKVFLPVRAVTGTGTVGTAIIGGGDGGGDAVIGHSGGQSTDVPGTGPSVIQASLVKSQSISAPDGSARPVHGATITYSIQAQFSGGGTAAGVVVADPIPAGTIYVASSMTIDGQSVTDAADGDQAAFSGSGISVALGDVPAPATHTISFKVKIN